MSYKNTAPKPPPDTTADPLRRCVNCNFIDVAPYHDPCWDCLKDINHPEFKKREIVF